MTDGIWAQRLQKEYEASDAEDLRLRQFFREQPSASAWSMRTFPKLPFLNEMAQLEKDGTADYISGQALGDDE